jgi:PAS domain S-box-containing protein
VVGSPPETLRNGVARVGKQSNVGQPLVQASLIGEAIDRGPVAVFVADEDMAYIAVNGFACDLLGYTREELLAKTVPDVAIEPGAKRDFEELVGSGTRTGRAALRRKDGTEVVLDYRATTTIVAGLTLYVSVGYPLDEASATPAPRRRSGRARG